MVVFSFARFAVKRCVASSFLFLLTYYSFDLRQGFISLIFKRIEWQVDV